MKKVLFVVLLFNFSFSVAQNIVNNPGFEVHTSCPTTISQITNATGWNNPNQYGTPDLYNNGGACNYLPSNAGQGTTAAHSGNGLVGLFAYRTTTTNREYLLNTLSTPMVIGQAYTVSFWAALSTTSGWSVNNIGVYFSVGNPPCTNTSSPCSASSVLMSSVTPQLVTSSFITTTWTQFTFTYTPTAAFNRMTIGRFVADNASNQFDTPVLGSTAYILFDDFVVQPITPLPVSLLNKQIVCASGGNMLKWTTASEINNDYFSIERTCNGIDYVLLGNITGSGNSNYLNSYSFFDENPCDGLSYYRLSQTDFDGNKEVLFYMSSLCNSINENCDVFAYPNPASDHVNIEACNHALILECTIHDSYGKLVKQVDYVMSNRLTVYMNAASSGLYIFTLKMENGDLYRNRFLIK